MINENFNLINDGFGAKGVAKVELFKEGKVVHSQEKNNFISNGFYEALKYKMMDSLLYGRPSDIGSESIDIFGDMFQRMWLTTAEHPERPNEEWVMKGDIVGYANSNSSYSGSDPYRGTINLNESLVDRNQVRLVFDFGTDRANGVFNSIYFSRERLGSISVYQDKYFLNKFGIRVLSLVVYNDKYYVMSSDLKLHVFDMFFNPIQEPVELETSSSLRDFTIYNNYIYVIHGYSDGIKRAPITDPNQLEDVINQNGRGIHYDTESESFYIFETEGSYSEGYVNVIYKFNKNFEIVSVREVPHYSGDYNNQNGICNIDNGFLLGQQYISDIEKSENTYNLTNFRITGTDERSLFLEKTRIPKIFIASRALLDSPVEKTDSTTMKITYTFHIYADNLI